MKVAYTNIQSHNLADSLIKHFNLQKLAFYLSSSNQQQKLYNILVYTIIGQFVYASTFDKDTINTTNKVSKIHVYKHTSIIKDAYKDIFSNFDIHVDINKIQNLLTTTGAIYAYKHHLGPPLFKACKICFDNESIYLLRGQSPTQNYKISGLAAFSCDAIDCNLEDFNLMYPIENSIESDFIEYNDRICENFVFTNIKLNEDSLAYNLLKLYSFPYIKNTRIFVDKVFYALKTCYASKGYKFIEV